MKRTIVLRGGPLDGHIREVDDRQSVAYFVHKLASDAEAARLGVEIVPGAGSPTVVLTYQQQGMNPSVWDYVGTDVAP